MTKFSSDFQRFCSVNLAGLEMTKKSLRDLARVSTPMLKTQGIDPISIGLNSKARV